MKRAKMNNKGFTLVELIVVLVILAILAAVLVPTLLGYIDRAKSEKDYSTAQSIRVACQSAIAEAYAKKTSGASVGEDDISYDTVWQLVGATATGTNSKKATLDGVNVEISSITIVDNQITAMKVIINSNEYNLKDNVWSGKSDSASTPETPTEG